MGTGSKGNPLPTPGMAGFSELGDEDLAPGTITGYRSWMLPAPGFSLNPLTADDHWSRSPLSGQRANWEPGVNEAVCRAGHPHEEPLPALVCGCVDPGTRILTADLRWVPAGDLAVGEHLMAFDEYPAVRGFQEQGGRKYRDAVVANTERGKLPCYDLRFDDGTTVRVSADHKWLVSSGQAGGRWLETSKLRRGDLRVSNVVKPFDTWETDRSYEAGYLAAAFDGEGNLFQHESRYQFHIGFTQAGNPMLEEVERCLKELGFNYVHAVAPRGYNKPLRVDGSPRLDMHRLTIARRFEFLRFLGSVRPPRLLPKLRPEVLGRMRMSNRVRLVEKTYVGEQEVVKLGTTTGTYFAEGLASHNCGFWGYFRLTQHNLGIGASYLAVDGVIEGWGRTRIGELGFRCSKARILALCPRSLIGAFTPGGASTADILRRHMPAGRVTGPGEPVGELPAEDQGVLDWALTWSAVIETRLEEMHPEAKVFTDSRAMLAAFPLDPAYAAPPSVPS